MIDAAPGTEAVVDNAGNRDNAIVTTCRVAQGGFRPDVLYVTPESQNEVALVDESGAVADAWFLDDSLDSLPNNPEVLRQQKQMHMPQQPRPNEFADQEAVGNKVSVRPKV